MAKAELKTKKSEDGVEDFLNTVKDEQQREDSLTILQMMKTVMGDEPKMWGTSIIGFGNVHLKYESGRELDWFTMGFSPRKKELTLYGVHPNEQPELLKKLGKYKTSKGCLYINKLSDVDATVLKKIIEYKVKEKNAKQE